MCSSRFWGVLGFTAIILLASPTARGETQHQIDSILVGMYHSLGIECSYKHAGALSWPLAAYENAHPNEYFPLLQYVLLLEEEMGKYSPSFLQKIGLKKIIVVKNLSYDGQLRAALPDYYQEILCLDFVRGEHSPAYQRHVIHHELFHMIEEAIHGDAYFTDLNWMSINKPGFVYGKGGVSVQDDPRQFAFIHPARGFINLYSISGQIEDRAEIFAALLMKKERKKVKRWMLFDRVLCRKVKYLRRFAQPLGLKL